jgi:2-furoyl-CoA dehydrogenase 2Fe-2S iron sulfur subunit
MPRLSKTQKTAVKFKLNGTDVTAEAEPRTLLSDFLRHDIGATGTHVGCEHGVCGACTVLVDGRVVRSCLTFAVQAEGREITTIEKSDECLEIIRRAFKENFALQCGFCTPGIIMSLADYLSHTAHADEDEIRELIGGHLCRCTGYTPIIEAAIQAAREIQISNNRVNDAG